MLSPLGRCRPAPLSDRLLDGHVPSPEVHLTSASPHATCVGSSHNHSPLPLLVIVSPILLLLLKNPSFLVIDPFARALF